jgi:hypothetical protein
MAAQHQRLDWQQQNLDPQQQGMHEPDCIDCCSPKLCNAPSLPDEISSWLLV